MSDEKPDTCYECVHSRICRFHTDVYSAITKNIDMVNIDGPERPGKMADIHTTIAMACMKFERDEG